MPASDGPRPGHRVLLLQDERSPNLQLIESVAAAGFVLVGPVGQVSQAIAWIETDRPDVVILDMALSDGVSFELADELHRRRIPFLFYTSWRNSDVRSADLESMSSPEKPLEFVLVMKLLSNMIKNRQSVEGPREEERDLTIER